MYLKAGFGEKNNQQWMRVTVVITWGAIKTCHFMGKKSVTGSPHLESPEEPAVPMVFGPSLRALLEDMMELLTRELLKILLQERLLDENQGKYDLTDQETGLLTKVLEKYFSN
ncbi:PREDICTED: uncharacterized protein LOC104293624 [Charadrius vociferus]|uniref:uncharacterized protein LOC104293624 n=1 Tax=Charadrius vociferus TaxID=50402 RepID=UPI0005218675|nr:PREDICTED: uncharacterized protein LOC104293624 [Charadrius vociferus]